MIFEQIFFTFPNKLLLSNPSFPVSLSLIPFMARPLVECFALQNIILLDNDNMIKR